MAEIELATVAQTVGAAVVYSLLFYLKKKAGDTNGDVSFDYYKIGATIVVGAFVGVSYALAGSPLDSEALTTQLVAMGGTVALVEGVLKTVYRAVVKQSRSV